VSSAVVHLESAVLPIASLALCLCGGVCPWSVLMLQTQGGGMCAESFQLGLMLCSITQHTVLTAMIYSVPSNPKP